MQLVFEHDYIILHFLPVIHEKSWGFISSWTLLRLSVFFFQILPVCQVWNNVFMRFQFPFPCLLNRDWVSFQIFIWHSHFFLLGNVLFLLFLFSCLYLSYWLIGVLFTYSRYCFVCYMYNRYLLSVFELPFYGSAW